MTGQRVSTYWPWSLIGWTRTTYRQLVIHGLCMNTMEAILPSGINSKTDHIHYDAIFCCCHVSTRIQELLVILHHSDICVSLFWYTEGGWCMYVLINGVIIGSGRHFEIHFAWQLLYWDKFITVQLTISYHWFKQWLGDEHATSHYLNQWWFSLLTHMSVTLPQWVKHNVGEITLQCVRDWKVC